jgi:opacity protein-like surface antigen
MGLGVALTLAAMAEASAQTDTTRPPTSEQRIPVRKEQGQITRRESGGEVTLRTTASRIDSLEMVAASYRTRLDSLEAANASILSRTEANERTINALRDSLNTVRGELETARAEMATMRTELSATTARTAVLADSLYRLDTRFNRFLRGSIFGNSGFYIGLGTGTNFTTEPLTDIGYTQGFHLAVPIGWQKPGRMLGARLELGYQDFDGRTVGNFFNVDPNIWSAVAMATLNFPFNQAKTNSVYLMGGGGVFMFRDFGPQSALTSVFAGSQDAEEAETKFGLQGGAGVQFHILGATSLFVQTSFVTVSADQVAQAGSSRNLRWVPLIAGLTLR